MQAPVVVKINKQSVDDISTHFIKRVLTEAEYNELSKKLVLVCDEIFRNFLLKYFINDYTNTERNNETNATY
jgi:hypothetical protein